MLRAAEPVGRLFQQFFKVTATVIARDGFVEVPPNTLNRIGFRRVLRQEVQLKSIAAA